jgi:hypothetical protein
VSYATPTYYADRLCERGRLYLYKTLNGAQAEELDIDKEKEIDRQRKNRNLTFRQNPDTNYNKSRDGQKSGAEVNQEQEDLATLIRMISTISLSHSFRFLITVFRSLGYRIYQSLPLTSSIILICGNSNVTNKVSYHVDSSLK